MATHGFKSYPDLYAQLGSPSPRGVDMVRRKSDHSEIGKIHYNGFDAEVSHTKSGERAKVKGNEEPIDVLMALHNKHSKKLRESRLTGFLEEVPANNAGGGNIDGIGVGPKGEPGVTRSAMDRYKKKNAEGAPKAGRKTLSLFMQGK